ncbi:MAG: helix-turn-helix domain-containing protein [Eubacteriaceae bacterium]
MSIGDKIADLLNQNNITQKEMAQNLSMAPSTFNGYIKSTREPDYSTLKKIAEYFNVSCDFLLEFETQRSKKMTRSKISEKKILTLFKVLDESQQELIVEMMKLMVKQKQRL